MYVFFHLFFLLQDFAAKSWVQKGVPKDKLIIGLPMYGRMFTLSDPAKFAVGDLSLGAAPAEQYTNEEGFLAYYEVKISEI